MASCPTEMATSLNWKNSMVKNFTVKNFSLDTSNDENFLQ